MGLLKIVTLTGELKIASVIGGITDEDVIPWGEGGWGEGEEDKPLNFVFRKISGLFDYLSIAISIFHKFESALMSFFVLSFITEKRYMIYDYL